MPKCSYVFTKTAFIITLASLSAGFLCTASAASLSDQWYLGAGYASSQLLPRAEDASVTRVDENGQGATVFLGRDFNERSSGQFQLYSLGDVLLSDDSIATYTAADASLLYRFYDTRDTRRNALFGLSVYGRFGIGVVERESTNALNTEGSSPVYFGAGAGLEGYLTDMLGVRSELLFHDRDTISANISLVARFGGRKGRGGYLPPLPLPSSNNTASIPQTQGVTPPRISTSATSQPQARPLPSIDTQNERLQRGSSGSTLDNSFDYTTSTDAPLPDVAVMAPPSEFREPGSNVKKPAANRTQPNPTVQQAQTDNDKDGVADNIDQCPKSNRSFPVSENGCSQLVKLGKQIKFVDNSPLPLSRTETVLQQLAATMIQYPTTKIEIIAHTDNAGDPLAKSAIARQRLRAIGIYLVQRGIQQDRFLLRSFAGKRPAFDNNTAAGRKANNRIELVERP